LTYRRNTKKTQGEVRKFLTKFETVMTTGNVGLDLDGGHDIAYERILAEFQTSRGDCKPLFLTEESADLGRCPVHSKFETYLE
jgi:hypothetical protein